jgi:hypothetical protein
VVFFLLVGIAYFIFYLMVAVLVGIIACLWLAWHTVILTVALVLAVCRFVASPFRGRKVRDDGSRGGVSVTTWPEASHTVAVEVRRGERSHARGQR